jgi:hypothetical protein
MNTIKVRHLTDIRTGAKGRSNCFFCRSVKALGQGPKGEPIDGIFEYIYHGKGGNYYRTVNGCQYVITFDEAYNFVKQGY